MAYRQRNIFVVCFRRGRSDLDVFRYGELPRPVFKFRFRLERPRRCNTQFRFRGDGQRHKISRLVRNCSSGVRNCSGTKSIHAAAARCGMHASYARPRTSVSLSVGQTHTPTGTRRGPTGAGRASWSGYRQLYQFNNFLASVRAPDRSNPQEELPSCFWVYLCALVDVTQTHRITQHSTVPPAHRA